MTPKTVRKWRDRRAAEGEAGLADRSSRPRGSSTGLSEPVEAEIEHRLGIAERLACCLEGPRAPDR